MNLVDSCGWLEYFANDSNADFFASPIQDTRTLLVPAICMAEVFKRVYIQRGERYAILAMAAMRQGQLVLLDEALAIDAARLGADLRLPLADSIILATARAHQATIWTQDSHFAKLPRVKYIAKRKESD